MLWAQRQCSSVELKDFSKSWRNGMAFCSIIHRYRPDAFDMASLDPKNAAENVELALSTAEKYFGVDRCVTQCTRLWLTSRWCCAVYRYAHACVGIFCGVEISSPSCRFLGL